MIKGIRIKLQPGRTMPVTLHKEPSREYFAFEAVTAWGKLSVHGDARVFLVADVAGFGLFQVVQTEQEEGERKRLRAIARGIRVPLTSRDVPVTLSYEKTGQAG